MKENIITEIIWNTLEDVSDLPTEVILPDNISLEDEEAISKYLIEEFGYDAEEYSVYE